MQITKNTVATIEYVLSSAEGRVLDTTSNRGPMMYLHGVGGILPGLEVALEGKAAGDNLKLTLEPAQAYGEKSPEKVIKVPKKDFSGAEPKPGMQFRAQGPSGSHLVTVVDVTEDTVTVDANHPLAGQSVTVEATVIEVRAASAEEVAHGHVCYGDGSCGRRCH